MITAIMIILIAVCAVRTIGYGIYVIKTNITGGISVFVLALLSLASMVVCFK